MVLHICHIARKCAYGAIISSGYEITDTRVNNSNTFFMCACLPSFISTSIDLADANFPLGHNSTAADTGARITGFSLCVLFQQDRHWFAGNSVIGRNGIFGAI